MYWFNKRTKSKYATFFGGTINDTTTPEYEQSISIGVILATNGYVVKNGGYSGLMEAVSKGAHNVSGTILGYTCKTFKNTTGNKYLTKNIKCKDIYDRLRCLISGSSVFVIQAGGIGTISELFLLIDECRKIEAIDKPTIYVFGEMNKKIIEQMIANKLLRKSQITNLYFCKDIKHFQEILF